MTESFQALQNHYWDWVRGQTFIRDLGGVYEITTPYLDRFNDCIQIHAKMLGVGKVLISDAGETLEDMVLSGHSYASGRLAPAFQEIMNGFGVSLDHQNESLKVECSLEDFPVTAHNLIQAILAINDLGYVTTSERIPKQATFRKQVKKKFSSFEGWKVTDDPLFTGKSGVPRKFNFMVNDIIVIQCFASISKQSVDAFIFAWLDAGAQNNKQLRCSALIQPIEGQNTTNACNIMKYYEIAPVIASSDMQNDFAKIMATR